MTTAPLEQLAAGLRARALLGRVVEATAVPRGDTPPAPEEIDETLAARFGPRAAA